MIIGISGVAGSGKDTLFSLFSSRTKCKKFSLADELKRETREWCIEHYGIDSLNCSREEKEQIRSFLVFHGTQKRLASEGRHWIEELNPKIKDYTESNGELCVITDIRYDDYERDEVYWLKNEINGILIHVEMILPDGSVVPPANPEEHRNDPKLKSKADFKIKWPYKEETGENLRKELAFYADEVLFQISCEYNI
tara:strand:+ start:610 stop:1197 length:588 start_codon:yes stop_codon:yes gene_type:complete